MINSPHGGSQALTLRLSPPLLPSSVGLKYEITQDVAYPHRPLTFSIINARSWRKEKKREHSPQPAILTMVDMQGDANGYLDLYITFISSERLPFTVNNLVGEHTVTDRTVESRLCGGDR